MSEPLKRYSKVTGHGESDDFYYVSDVDARLAEVEKELAKVAEAARDNHDSYEMAKASRASDKALIARLVDDFTKLANRFQAGGDDRNNHEADRAWGMHVAMELRAILDSVKEAGHGHA